MNEKSHCDKPPSLADLYPQLNEDKRKEAEENLERYLALMLRIYNRIQQTQGFKPLGTCISSETYETPV